MFQLIDIERSVCRTNRKLSSLLLKASKHARFWTGTTFRHGLSLLPPLNVFFSLCLGLIPPASFTLFFCLSPSLSFSLRSPALLSTPLTIFSQYARLFRVSQICFHCFYLFKRFAFIFFIGRSIFCAEQCVYGELSLYLLSWLLLAVVIYVM